ncbi:hypothetical protein FNF27_03504 [Cafeteria roenbergensis]|uniref:Uncharacterized protein n=1 Tax=Cafeteria roenbergensis TaxID=33653 RepID=A0A5A8EBK3_CAFRO|nr:hypothetical protein FNF27_03504 [Cafeteria roenbergensis]
MRAPRGSLAAWLAVAAVAWVADCGCSARLEAAPAGESADARRTTASAALGAAPDRGRLASEAHLGPPGPLAEHPAPARASAFGAVGDVGSELTGGSSARRNAVSAQADPTTFGAKRAKAPRSAHGARSVPQDAVAARLDWANISLAAMRDGRTLPDDVPVDVTFASDEIEGGPPSSQAGDSPVAVTGDYAANASLACLGRALGPCWNTTGWCGAAASSALASREARLAPSIRVHVQDSDAASATLVPVGAANVVEGGARRVAVALSQPPVTGALSFRVAVDAAASAGVEAPWLRTAVGPAEEWTVVAGLNSTGSSLERTVSLAGDSVLSSPGTIGLRLTGTASLLPRFQIAATVSLASVDSTLRGLVVDGVTTSAGSGACSAAQTAALLGWRDPAIGVTSALGGASKVFVAPVETVAPGGAVSVALRLTASPMQDATLTLQAQAWRWDDAAGTASLVPGLPVASVTPSVVHFSASNWSTPVPVSLSVASPEATAFLASGRNASVALAVASVTMSVGASDPLHLPTALAATVGLRLPSMRAAAQTADTAGVLRLVRFAQPGLTASTPGCSGGTAWLNGGGTASWSIQLASQPSASVDVLVSSDLLATKQLVLAPPIPENSAPAANGSLLVTVLPEDWNSGFALAFDRNASSAPGAYTSLVLAVVASATGDASYSAIHVAHRNAEQHPDPDPDPDPDSDPDSDSLQLSDPVCDCKPDPNPVRDRQPDSDPVGHGDQHANAVSDCDADSHPESDVVADSNSDSDADADADADVHTDADWNQHADPHAHAHQHLDADSDPDADGHAYPHSLPDAHAVADTEQHRHAVALPHPVAHPFSDGNAEPWRVPQRDPLRLLVGGSHALANRCAAGHSVLARSPPGPGERGPPSLRREGPAVPGRRAELVRLAARERCR